jgi:hypothetical protein
MDYPEKKPSRLVFRVNATQGGGCNVPLGLTLRAMKTLGYLNGQRQCF